MNNVAGVILAGGKSSRMGENKSELDYHGRSLLQHMEMLLHEAGVEDVYISDKNNITDDVAAKGPLGGVHATLRKLREKHDYLIYVPVDMPSLKPSLLGQLIKAPTEHNIVRFTDYILPFRLKSNSVQTSLIEQILESNNYSLKDFQGNFDIHQLEVPDSASFININTAEEWHEFTN